MVWDYISDQTSAAIRHTIAEISYKYLISYELYKHKRLRCPISLFTSLSLGYEDKRTVLMCASETRTIVCEMGKFIWIRQSRIGVSLSYTQDMTTGVESCPINIDCQEPYGAAYQGTTFRSFRGLSVPDVTLTCMDNEQQANYLYIEYSCITGKTHKSTQWNMGLLPDT